MHFCVSAARGGLYGQGCWPRKIGTNWFMPALVKSRFGESGTRLEEGTMVCCFDLKKSRNDWRISELVIFRVGEVTGDDWESEGEKSGVARADAEPKEKIWRNK